MRAWLLVLVHLVIFRGGAENNTAIFKSEHDFRSPLDIPLVLAGNFGELRPNHFHSGIDITTKGKTGLKVHSIEEGYVSRVYVSSTGYGRAIYVTHPNGLTSVYGHLKGFSEKVSKYVLKEHYARETFYMNAFFEAGEIPITKGEVIGFSGNAGSSGGPHLHFEIRDTKTEDVLNPLKFNFDIKDHRKPNISRIRIFPADETGLVQGKPEGASFSTVNVGDGFRLKGNPSVKVSGNIGVGLEAIDYLDGGWAKCGVSDVKLFVDETLVYHHNMDRFSFAESRYINTFIDYNLYKEYSRKYMRTYKAEGNNELSIYRKVVNDGKIHFDGKESKMFRLEVSDSYGNMSICKWKLTGEDAPVAAVVPKIMDRPMRWDTINVFERDGILLTFPAKTFYDDIDFEFKTSASKNVLSPIYYVHNKRTAVQNYFDISIELDMEVPDADKVYITTTYKGRPSYGHATKRYGNIYSTKNKAFDNFALALDTIKPRITSLDLYQGKKIQKYRNLRFKISDVGSGVKSYRGEIDGKWVMFEQYRPSSNPTYWFDESRIARNQKHHITFTVTDKVGNESVYACDFYW